MKWINLQPGRFPDEYDEDDERELVSATAVDIDYPVSGQHVENSPEKVQVLLLLRIKLTSNNKRFPFSVTLKVP